MPKLDFTPLEPHRMRRVGHRLIGARYCSIGGKIAAQIRLMDAHERSLTLYEFRPGHTYGELTAHELNIDGVIVAMWQEGGLVMALARSQE